MLINNYCLAMFFKLLNRVFTYFKITISNMFFNLVSFLNFIFIRLKVTVAVFLLLYTVFSVIFNFGCFSSLVLSVWSTIFLIKFILFLLKKSFLSLSEFFTSYSKFKKVLQTIFNYINVNIKSSIKPMLNFDFTSIIISLLKDIWAVLSIISSVIAFTIIGEYITLYVIKYFTIVHSFSILYIIPFSIEVFVVALYVAFLRIIIFIAYGPLVFIWKKFLDLAIYFFKIILPIIFRFIIFTLIPKVFMGCLFYLRHILLFLFFYIMFPFFLFLYLPIFFYVEFNRYLVCNGFIDNEDTETPKPAPKLNIDWYFVLKIIFNPFFLIKYIITNLGRFFKAIAYYYECFAKAVDPFINFCFKFLIFYYVDTYFYGSVFFWFFYYFLLIFSIISLISNQDDLDEWVSESPYYIHSCKTEITNEILHFIGTWRFVYLDVKWLYNLGRNDDDIVIFVFIFFIYIPLLACSITFMGELFNLYFGVTEMSDYFQGDPHPLFSDIMQYLVNFLINFF